MKLDLQRYQVDALIKCVEYQLGAMKPMATAPHCTSREAIACRLAYPVLVELQGELHEALKSHTRFDVVKA